MWVDHELLLLDAMVASGKSVSMALDEPGLLLLTNDLNYSWILYLQICLLTKIYLPSSNQYLTCICSYLWTSWVWQKNWVHRHEYSWLRLEQGDAGPCYFSSSTANKCCFLWSVQGHFFCGLFNTFYWWFYYLKWLPSTVLKCCVVFQSIRRLWCTLQRNTCVR
jgi:hypothetical protein